MGTHQQAMAFFFEGLSKERTEGCLHHKPQVIEITCKVFVCIEFQQTPSGGNKSKFTRAAQS